MRLLPIDAMSNILVYLISMYFDISFCVDFIEKPILSEVLTRNQFNFDFISSSVRKIHIFDVVPQRLKLFSPLIHSPSAARTHISTKFDTGLVEELRYSSFLGKSA